MSEILKPDTLGTQLADMERRLRIMENTSRVTPAVTQAGWGVNKYKMRVYLTGAQSVASGASGSRIHFDSAAAPYGYDSSNAFDATNHWYVIPIAGFWLVSFVAQIALTGAITWFQFAAFVYNNTLSTSYDLASTNAGTINAGSGSCLNATYSAGLANPYYFDVGTQVQVVAQQTNNAGTLQPLVANTATYMALHLIST